MNVMHIVHDAGDRLISGPALRPFAEVVAYARKRPGKIMHWRAGRQPAVVLMTDSRKRTTSDINLSPTRAAGRQPGFPGRLHRTRHPEHASFVSMPRKKLLPIAVTCEKRTPSLPDPSTLIEQT